MPERYHHGSLRAALLQSAIDIIAADGPDALSMRELARRTQVTHAAPAYHFGDRRGLFTAVAVQGFGTLADALESSIEDRDFKATAVSYVRFALDHPGYFAVMFRRDILDASSGELTEARDRSFRLLSRGVAQLDDSRRRTTAAAAELAAWSLVHGFASLWLSGAIRPEMSSDDPLTLATELATQLFG